MKGLLFYFSALTAGILTALYGKIVFGYLVYGLAYSLVTVGTFLLNLGMALVS